MTAGMLLWLFAAAVVSVAAAALVRHGATTPRLYSSQKQLRRIRQARQRKAQDVRNHQLMYQIDQNNKRRK